MTRNELLRAWGEGLTILWNDPDPIPGNDYEVIDFTVYANGTVVIKYNGGDSEAEVPLDELEAYDYEIPDKVLYTLCAVADLLDGIQHLMPRKLHDKLYDVRTDIEELKEDLHK